MKTCFKCAQEKPFSEFYKHSQMKDGHLNKCIDCAKSDSISHRRDNLEYYTSYEKHRARQPHRIAARYQYAQTPEGIEAGNRAKVAWAKRNPVKRKAAVAVCNAVRDGRIEKLENCEECGSEGRIHGHHDDYAKPLEVRWLCPSCHTSWHKENGEAKNGKAAA